MAHEEIKLTRRDMARAEISSAIDLFAAGDVVSAHVLAFSAKAIIRGVARAEKIETFDDVLEQRIKPEFLKVWRDAIYDSYNVFKHANEDPHRQLENFRPDTTSIALFTAVVNYGLLYKQRTLPMNLYFGWFLSRHPGFALPPLSESVAQWKGVFGNPEGKPLAEALSPLAEMLPLAKRYIKQFVARLLPNPKVRALWRKCSGACMSQ